VDRFVLDRFVLDRFVLDGFVVDGFVLDRFVLDRFVVDGIVVDRFVVDRFVLDGIVLDRRRLVDRSTVQLPHPMVGPPAGAQPARSRRDPGTCLTFDRKRDDAGADRGGGRGARDTA
jgi:hypothetical protein